MSTAEFSDLNRFHPEKSRKRHQPTSDSRVPRGEFKLKASERRATRVVGFYVINESEENESHSQRRRFRDDSHTTSTLSDPEETNHTVKTLRANSKLNEKVVKVLRR